MLYFSFCFTFWFTIILTLAKKDWGYTPLVVVRVLENVLGTLIGWKNREIGKGYRPGSKKYLTVEYLQREKYNNPLEASVDLLGLGVQSILQDDLTNSFTLQNEEASLLTLPKEKSNWPFYVFSVAARYGFLLPLRICFMIATWSFLISTSLVCVLLDASQKYTLYCGITFAKLFNISTGLIINSHDKENRPKFPGVAVANHLSANDVMTLFSQCEYNGKGYAITGQAQGGFVKYLYKYGGKLTPILLVNRDCDRNRNAFKQAIVDHSKQPDESCYPVLLFPEGYCTNNKAVLQFRKAVFDGHAPIYPIAVKQNVRFGNLFWFEKTYLPYLLRMMTSWCSIIDIYYLPAMFKFETESEEKFAERVQVAIAQKLGVNALPFDGKLKNEKERLKYREKLQSCLCSAFEQWEKEPEL